MRALLPLLVLTLAGPAGAETLVALRIIPARAVVEEADVGLMPDRAAGALNDPGQAVGLETRVALYPGRPIRAADLGPPAVVERNQVVPLVYQGGALTITTEGRTLDRAAAGETIRVMNLDSRATVTARIDAAGVAHVE